MQLYFAPGTIARASLIALCETGVPFDPVRVDFASAEQRGKTYLTINPKGRVPALATSHGTLTETSALLPYIASLAPAALLLPDDPFERARMDELMSYLASTVHVNHAHKMRGHRWANQQASWDDMAGKVTENMTECAALIESAYLQGPWVLGDHYTVADAYLFAVTSWLDGDGVPLSALPRIAAHQAAMRDRPAVRRALEIEHG